MDKEYTLKIIGEANLPEPLENEKDYLISVHGSVVSKTEKPKWTGKMEEIFKFKVLTAEVLMDRGRTIKTIDKTRQSQKIRRMIDNWRKDNYSEIPEEEFYVSFTNKILVNFEEIARLLEKLK